MSGLPFDWVISDTHFGHANINRYCWRTTPAYPTPEAVDQLMYNNWHRLVGPYDRILHLGDLCKWDQGDPMPQVMGLPGKKFILLGNHDNYPEWWYDDHGFEIVAPSDIDFHHVGEMGEATVRFTHFPLRPLPPQTVNLHGHVHNNPYSGSPSHLNLSVEVTHFAPVPLAKALDKVMWGHVKQGPPGRAKRS